MILSTLRKIPGGTFGHRLQEPTVEFAVTPRGGYPAIYLTPNFNIISIAQYYHPPCLTRLPPAKFIFKNKRNQTDYLLFQPLGQSSS